jgi:hypothetical protein
MISPDPRVPLGEVAERRVTRKLYVVPRPDEVTGTGARNNNCAPVNNVVDNTSDNVVPTGDDNVVPADDEAANDGTTTINDQPHNTNALAFVGPRIVWGPRPDVCGRNKNIVTVCPDGTLLDFKPAATTDDGTTLYSLTTTPPLARLRTPRSGDTGC